MSRRGLLGMVAAAGALAGCSTVSSGAAKLQKSYAAETGVASVSVISRWQQETIFYDIWSAEVLFADGLAADRKAQLIARFFELASREGLPSDRFDYVIFNWAKETHLIVHIPLDAGQSAELLGTMGQAAEGGGSVDAGPPPDFGVLWVRDAQDGVAFLDAAQPLLSVPRAASFFTNIAVESKLALPSQGFRLSSDHALTEGDLRLLSFLRYWLPAHRVLSLRIPLSRDVDGLLRVTTPDDQTAAVRQLAAVVRTAGIPATINGYRLGNTDPYVSIP